MELKYYKIVLLGNVAYDVSSYVETIEELTQNLFEKDFAVLTKASLPRTLFFTDKLIAVSEQEVVSDELKRRSFKLE